MHAVSRLIVQGQVQDRCQPSLAARRWSQRQKAAQRLLDQPLRGWLRPGDDGETFWRWLRWGGAGLLLGWVLAQATSGRS